MADARRVFIERGNVRLNSLEGVDPVSIILLDAIYLIYPSPIDGDGLEKFSNSIPLRQLIYYRIKSPKLLLLSEDFAKFSSQSSFKILKEVTRGIVWGFMDPSKSIQDPFLLVEDIPKSRPVPIF